MESWSDEAAIVEECLANGFCWRPGNLKIPGDSRVFYDFWTLHDGVLWRGCVPYATYDAATGARARITLPCTS